MIWAGLIAMLLSLSVGWPTAAMACIFISEPNASQALAADAVVVASVETATIVHSRAESRYLIVDLDVSELIRGDLRGQALGTRLTVAHGGTKADEETVARIVGRTHLIALVWTESLEVHRVRGEPTFTNDRSPPWSDMFAVDQSGCGYPFFLILDAGASSTQEILADIRAGVDRHAPAPPD